jgi:hypothetical protein
MAAPFGNSFSCVSKKGGPGTFSRSEEERALGCAVAVCELRMRFFERGDFDLGEAKGKDVGGYFVDQK